jgi:hypothetical protein
MIERMGQVGIVVDDFAAASERSFRPRTAVDDSS